MFFFTDADHTIIVKGESYTPIGGIHPSAKSAELGLRDSNIEFRGVLTSDAMTFDDLQSGKFNRSLVTEFVVDWRYPFASPMRSKVFEIQDFRYTGEIWVANLAGRTRKLQSSQGHTADRDCEYEFGGPKCTFPLDTVSELGIAISSIDDVRRIFRASTLSASYNDDDFNQGKCTFLTGTNAGFEVDIKNYTKTNRIIELQLELPFDVEVGDTFNISRGCDGTFGVCSAYGWTLFFGGNPHVPGSDRANRTPVS